VTYLRWIGVHSENMLSDLRSSQLKQVSVGSLKCQTCTLESFIVILRVHSILGDYNNDTPWLGLTGGIVRSTDGSVAFEVRVQDQEVVYRALVWNE